MVDKDYQAILAKYGFKDPLGHLIERCGDYLELLAELERLRAAEKEQGQTLSHDHDSDPSN